MVMVSKKKTASAGLPWRFDGLDGLDGLGGLDELGGLGAEVSP
jgi:hypothetical protein